MWTFVGSKRRKRRLWLVVERASRRVVAGVLARRGYGPPLALPRRYRRYCWYFTNLFPAYAEALPCGPHRPCPKTEGQTSVVGALNCALRQRCGVRLRKPNSFSKLLAMHAARIKNLHCPI